MTTIICACPLNRQKRVSFGMIILQDCGGIMRRTVSLKFDWFVLTFLLIIMTHCKRFFYSMTSALFRHFGELSFKSFINFWFSDILGVYLTIICSFTTWPPHLRHFCSQLLIEFNVTQCHYLAHWLSDHESSFPVYFFLSPLHLLISSAILSHFSSFLLFFTTIFRIWRM